MKRLILSAAALGLLMSPALAQTSSTTTPEGAAEPAASQSDAQATAGDTSGSTAPDDQAAQDSAKKSAEGIGMKDVVVIDRAFVLQGTTETGRQVYMIANPPGVLLGFGAPMAGAEAEKAAGSETDASAAASADSGSAAPQAWDPEKAEGAMKDLGLDKAE